MAIGNHAKRMKQEFERIKTLFGQDTDTWEDHEFFLGASKVTIDRAVMKQCFDPVIADVIQCTRETLAEDSLGAGRVKVNTFLLPSASR